jgi:hypothetical protein
VNIHRDSFASYCGHHGTLSYFAVAENESIGRVKYNFMQVRAPTSHWRSLVKTLGV